MSPANLPANLEKNSVPSKPRGLEVQPDFMLDNHLLAVLIVSDEEDCSIRDKGLFETEEWRSGLSELFNVACNATVENETFLFPTNDEEIQAIVDQRGVDPAELSTFRDKLVALKDGNSAAVIFSAIVGVPRDEDVDGEVSPCQGDGLELAAQGCLDANEMQMNMEEFETDKGPITHFTPACTRQENGTTVIEARPGRRFVKTAQEFGSNGYVYSICNEDWNPAMKSIAEIIARGITATCFDTALPWTPLPTAEQTTLGCPSCGTAAACDMFVEITRSGSDIADESCPVNLYTGLSTAEEAEYLAKKSVEHIQEKGVLTRKIISCALPKMPAPLNCDEAIAYSDQSQVGWFYCETKGENFNDACKDGVDNDDDNANGIVNDQGDNADCADADCTDCPICGGTGVECGHGCKQSIELTGIAKNLAVGHYISIKCNPQTSSVTCP